MTNLPDSVITSTLNIPGTHDTASARARDNQKLYKTHRYDYVQQLNIGTRLFDLRIHGSGSNSSYLCHSGSQCDTPWDQKYYFSYMQQQTIDFLDKNSNETVFWICRNEKGNESDVAKDILKFIEENYDYIYKMQDSYGDAGAPSLGDVRGKLVMLSRVYSIDSIKEDIKTWNTNNPDKIITESMFGINLCNWGSHDYKNLDNPLVNVYSNNGVNVSIQDNYNVSAGAKWPFIANTMALTITGNTPKNGWIFNCTSTGSSLNPPNVTATEINRKLYFDEWNYINNKLLGGMIFNFIDFVRAQKIIDTNFASGADFLNYDLKYADVTLSGSTKYTGDPIKPLVEVKVDGKAVVFSEYTVEYSNNINVGSEAKVTITGKNNKYFATKTINFSITKGDATVKTIGNVDKVFDGTPAEDPGVSSDSTGAVTYKYYTDKQMTITTTKENSGASAEGLPPVYPGTYYGKVNVAADSNHNSCSCDFSFTIAPEKLSLSIDGSYDENTDKGILNCHVGGLSPGFDSLAGSIKFTISQGGSSQTNTVVIDAATSKATWTNIPNVPAGQYEVKAEYIADENHPLYVADYITQQFDKSKTYTKIKLDVTEYSKKYGDEDFNLGAKVQNVGGVDVSGASLSYELFDPIKALNPEFKETANVDSTGKVSVENAGIVLIKVNYSGDGTYNSSSAVVRVKISRSELTVTSFAYDKDDSSKKPITEATYGELGDLAYDAKYEGFVGEDTPDTFTNGFGTIEVKDIDEKSNAGDYEIELFKKGNPDKSVKIGDKEIKNVFVSRNYAINLVKGTLKVKQRELTIKAEDAEGAYSDSEPTYTYTVVGILEGETQDMAIATEPTISLKNVGEDVDYRTLTPNTYVGYIVPYGVIAESNYAIKEYQNGDLTVVRGNPQVTVTANDIICDHKTSPDVVVNKPSDYDGTISEKWFTSEGIELSMPPTEIGSYIVKVSGPETELYNRFENAARCEIVPKGIIGIPTAEQKLSYNGEEQIGVPEGEGYTITGNKATKVGEYTAIAKLEDLYIWEDGSFDDKAINWSIALPDPLSENHEIIEQSSQVFYLSQPEDITFRSNADFDIFYEVQVDNEVVDPKNYIVKSGSTVVTLKSSFLKTFDVGEHVMKIVSMDGYAESKFSVDKEPPVNPSDDENTQQYANTATGDSTPLFLLISIISILMLYIVIVCLGNRRTVTAKHAKR